MDAIVAALITGLLGIAAVYLTNRWQRRSYNDLWQKRAGELDERLQIEHDRRVADLKSEVKRANERADRAEDQLRRREVQGHGQ